MIKVKKDYLWLIFFIIIFINGFEAGGYQASILGIGEDFDLTNTTKGIYASVELFATMLAPLFLGSWSDRIGKIKAMIIMLAIEFSFSNLIYFTITKDLFIIGIFFLGLTTSALQFITIAALTDVYPETCGKKIGIMTSMYALGAFVAPLVVKFYLTKGLTWRMLFLFLAVGSFLCLVGVLTSDRNPREAKKNEEGLNEEASGTKFIVIGILLLCAIMCIYVGFENGFAYFIDTFFADSFSSTAGKYALSMYWFIMIPARIWVGYNTKHAKKILLASVIVIPITTVFITLMPSAVAVFILCIPLGFASGAIYPSVLNEMLKFAGNKTGTATGMITTATGVGGFVFTALTGFLADALGLRMALICLGSFFVISIACVLALKD